jgi:hypothetical protein
MRKTVTSPRTAADRVSTIADQIEICAPSGTMPSVA